jgi:hypothetical protein
VTDRPDARAKEAATEYEPPAVDDLETPAGIAVTAPGAIHPISVVSAPRNV